MPAPLGPVPRSSLRVEKNISHALSPHSEKQLSPCFSEASHKETGWVWRGQAVCDSVVGHMKVERASDSRWWGCLFLHLAPPYSNRSPFLQGCGWDAAVSAIILPTSYLYSGIRAPLHCSTQPSVERLLKRPLAFEDREQRLWGKRAQALTLVLFVGINVNRQNDLKYPVGEKRQNSEAIRSCSHNPLLRLWGEDALLLSPWLS